MAKTGPAINKAGDAKIFSDWIWEEVPHMRRSYRKAEP